MREKLKKDKEEAEKKRLAEENAAAEAKSRVWNQIPDLEGQEKSGYEPWLRENFS